MALPDNAFVISSATADHAGTYTCVASNLANTRYSRPASISVSGRFLSSRIVFGPRHPSILYICDDDIVRVYVRSCVCVRACACAPCMYITVYDNNVQKAMFDFFLNGGSDLKTSSTASSWSEFVASADCMV